MVHFSAKKVKGQGHSEVTKFGKSLSLSIGQISIAHKSMEINNIILKFYGQEDMPNICTPAYFHGSCSIRSTVTGM